MKQRKYKKIAKKRILGQSREDETRLKRLKGERRFKGKKMNKRKK